MIGIQKAMRKFYNQFAPAYNEQILVTPNTLFPYITYTVNTSEIFTSALSTFQIWDKAENTLRLDGISKMIHQAIPNIVGGLVPILEDEIYEFYDDNTGMWVKFNLEDMTSLTADFYSQNPDSKFEWRENGGNTVGALKIFRGTPFMQMMPVNPDERELIRYLGNIEIRNYLGIVCKMEKNVLFE